MRPEETHFLFDVSGKSPSEHALIKMMSEQMEGWEKSAESLDLEVLYAFEASAQSLLNAIQDRIPELEKAEKAGQVEAWLVEQDELMAQLGAIIDTEVERRMMRQQATE